MFSGYSGVREVFDIAHHLVLPALVMAFDFLAYQYLLTRLAMVGELGADSAWVPGPKGWAGGG